MRKDQISKLLCPHILNILKMRFYQLPKSEHIITNAELDISALIGLYIL